MMKFGHGRVFPFHRCLIHAPTLTVVQLNRRQSWDRRTKLHPKDNGYNTFPNLKSIMSVKAP